MPALFRAIRSRKGHPFLKEALEVVKDAVAAEFKEHVVDDLESITAGWSHQPTWNVRFYGNADPLKLTINPRDDEAGKIFTYQDQGTRAHTIVPRRARVLAFEAKSGGMVFTKRVRHPGTKAQRFIEKRLRGYQAEFRRVVENAFRRGLR